MQEQTWKILFVEDDDRDYELISYEIERGANQRYKLTRAATLEDANTQLANNIFDVILLDLNLPDSLGLATAKQLQVSENTAPIIILTIIDDTSTALQAVRDGAQDYLIKGRIDADIFWRTLYYSVERKKNEENLKQARDEAEAATRAKSEFLAHMSHEIRTPLSIILGVADLLADSELDIKQKEYVNSFKTAGNTLLNLINELLDLSKIEAGKLDVQFQDFNLHELIQVIVKFLKIEAEKKHNVLTFGIQADIPEIIKGDPRLIRQVIYNLLGNAIKFTNEGKIHLEVVIDENNDLRFSVSDTGIGIDHEKLGTVFESFTQVENSVSRQHTGTGLGLAICSKFVKLWGGRIWAESGPDQGTQFIFTHPFQEQEKSDELVSPQVRVETLPDLSEILSEFSESHPIKVLIVDDHAVNRMIFNAYLSDGRIKISEAENGEQALDLYKSGVFDVILMDMQMPVMDGYTCVLKIREWEQSMNIKNIPIIALTAMSQKKDEQKCIEAGCSAYLSKPLRRNQLFYILTNVLSGE